MRTNQTPDEEERERSEFWGNLLGPSPTQPLEIIACQVGGGGDWHWQPRWANGRELARWTEGPALHAFTTQLRAAGWGLTETRQTQDAHGMRILRLVFTYSQDTC